MKTKPHVSLPRQKWVTFWCRECDTHFKVDMHESFDGKKMKIVVCPLCRKNLKAPE